MAKNEPKSGLYFSFAEMQREISNMASMAEPFLDQSTQPSPIPNWLTQLKLFQTSAPGTEFVWTIPKGQPIKTIRSPGDYEPDSKGEHTVFATVSSIWEIAIPETVGQTPKKGVPQKHFTLVGKASTRVSVFSYSQEGNHKELARWRFEIGDAKSPGCHFHAQVLGDEDDAVFPKSMPVPRLPNLLFTPMDAVEFVLAELFQDSWKQHASMETNAIRVWGGCQKQRLINLLRWQQDRLAKCTGSPWTALKAQKPDPKLMLQLV